MKSLIHASECHACGAQVSLSCPAQRWCSGTLCYVAKPYKCRSALPLRSRNFISAMKALHGENGNGNHWMESGDDGGVHHQGQKENETNTRVIELQEQIDILNETIQEQANILSQQAKTMELLRLYMRGRQSPTIEAIHEQEKDSKSMLLRAQASDRRKLGMYDARYHSTSSGATPKDFRLLPKRIILVRHAQSEGNVDNSAYTYLPDPQVSAIVWHHILFVQWRQVYSFRNLSVSFYHLIRAVQITAAGSIDS